jgi:hypothetical protein
MTCHAVSSGDVTAPVTRPDTPADLGTHPRVTPPAPTRVTTTSEKREMRTTMNAPEANVLRQIEDRDREYATRRDQFAGSIAERRYGARLLGRVIGHAAAQLADEAGHDAADTPDDIAAASAAARWQAYAAITADVRPAVLAFGPIERLIITADACQLAGM